MQFEPEQLLQHLNREMDWKSIAFALKSKAKWSDASPGADTDYREAPAAFREHLQELVNEWIGSGRNGDLDEPRKRSLTPGLGAHTALLRWLNDSRPHEWIAPTGEIGQDLTRRAAKRVDGSPAEIMRREAIAEFAKLMNSEPYKYQIARCNRCEDYYFRKKLRSFYFAENGTFCAKCRSAASAMRRTKEKRDAQHVKLVEKAAQASKDWSTLSEETRAKYKTENNYIAAKLRRFDVGVKWVTRNMITIKEYAQGGEHGNL